MSKQQRRQLAATSKIGCWWQSSLLQGTNTSTLRELTMNTIPCVTSQTLAAAVQLKDIVSLSPPRGRIRRTDLRNSHRRRVTWPSLKNDLPAGPTSRQIRGNLRLKALIGPKRLDPFRQLIKRALHQIARDHANQPHHSAGLLSVLRANWSELKTAKNSLLILTFEICRISSFNQLTTKSTRLYPQ